MAELEYKGETRDPVHGLIPLTSVEFKIIDSAAFQRLRNIKQLALACLGFYGAIHTRFEHSIGTMHVVSKIADHLSNTKDINLDIETKQILRLTGLLHDIGHGPFSHLSESLLEHFNKNLYTNGNTEELHEKISRRIITEDKEITCILGGERSNKIADLLKTDSQNIDFMHDIVSGSLDSDKMDYLLRDSYYAGVKYGMFDIDRLINVLTVIDDSKKKRLAVKIEGIEAVEQYVLAKYFITRQVYQHKIRHITDILVIEGMKHSITDGNKELEKLYKYSTDKEYIDYYKSFDDHRAFNSLLSNSDKYSLGYRYFDMLKYRKLFKRLYDKKFIEINPSASIEALTKLKELNITDHSELKETISKQIAIAGDLIHVVVYSLKNPLIQKDLLFDEQSIRIKKGPKHTSVLDRESTLYSSILESAKKYSVSVFGYLESCPEKIDYHYYENKIHPILVEYFGG